MAKIDCINAVGPHPQAGCCVDFATAHQLTAGGLRSMTGRIVRIGLLRRNEMSRYHFEATPARDNSLEPRNSPAQFLPAGLPPTPFGLPASAVAGFLPCHGFGEAKPKPCEGWRRGPDEALAKSD
ncbi:MAG TPA: hypothetical protein VGC53_00320, partial [Vicinamibacteria bacterium]